MSTSNENKTKTQTVMHNNVRVEVDYLGNIYLRFGKMVYNIFFDSQSQNGIELSRISDTNLEKLHETCEDYSHIMNHLLTGEIILSDSTLKGRVTQILSELDPEELDDESQQNMLNDHNTTFKEETFFRVKSTMDDDVLDDDWDDMDIIDKYTTSNDIEYRFSGVKMYEQKESLTIEDKNEEMKLKFYSEIYFSNILNDSLAYNDTLMIKGDCDSKIVTSCIQRTDGFCTRRLVFYSDGKIKVQYPSSHTIRLQLMWNGKDIDVHYLNREKDY